MGMDQLPVAALASFDRPYPDRNTINIHGSGFLKGALAALACTALGGAGVLGLMHFLKPSTPAATSSVIDNTKNYDVDYDAELIEPPPDK